jgi:hypothetical protein
MPGRSLAVTTLFVVLLAAGVEAQTFYYNEVTKDGHIYVFAIAARYEAFVAGDAAEKSTAPVITRAGYGPNGETVVFDSENAINLYNFRHGLPGESFTTPEETKKPDYPSGKFSGLMFGDYYWYFNRHQDGISPNDPTPVEGQHGLWFRRIYFTYDFTYSEKRRGSHSVRQGRVSEVGLHGQTGTDARHPSDDHVRLVRRFLGSAAHREDTGRSLPA